MNRKKEIVTKTVLCILCCIAFSLTAAVRTPARSANPSKYPKAIARNINAAVKSRLLHVLERAARTDPKLAKAISKGCGCAAMTPDDLGGSWGSCFKRCMGDVGVGYYALIMCGAACAAAATGAGAIVCALCVGVSVTVVEWCALGCAAYPDGLGGSGGKGMILTKNIKHRPPRASQVTKT